MTTRAYLYAHVTGEMAVGDVPLSQGVTEETIRNIQGDDTDPMQVVIEVGPGKGGRGWNYGDGPLQKLVDYVQQHTLNGFLGHQKEEDLATQFPTPVSHWVGAKWQDGRAYFRGVIDPKAPDLKRWIKAGRITQPSIFTRPTLSKRGAETDVTDLEPLSIDWAPLHRAGMPTAAVVAWGEMDDAGSSGSTAPPSPGAPAPNSPEEEQRMPTLREVAAQLRELNATPGDLLREMHWRADDVLPALVQLDKRGVVEDLPDEVVAEMRPSRIAERVPLERLLPAYARPLEEVGPLVSRESWGTYADEHRIVGEMATLLALPSDQRQPDQVLTAVRGLHTSTLQAQQSALRTQVERVLSSGEMSIPEVVRPALRDLVLGKVQPGATDDQVKTAVGEMKAHETIKPLLERFYGQGHTAPQSGRSSGEMQTGGNGAPLTTAGLGSFFDLQPQRV